MPAIKRYRVVETRERTVEVAPQEQYEGFLEALVKAHSGRPDEWTVTDTLVERDFA